MTFRTVCRAGLLLAGLTLSFTAAGRLPAARAAIQDGPYPASLNAQRASLHVLATPAGVYGVLTAGEFGREVFPAAALLAVRVTYIYQSPACDERGCAVLPHKGRPHLSLFPARRSIAAWRTPLPPPCACCPPPRRCAGSWDSARP